MGYIVFSLPNSYIEVLMPTALEQDIFGEMPLKRDLR
jgi:hypothetical protein